VQRADDDERGSANTTGEEADGRRNASKQGGVGPSEQPAQLQWPHTPSVPAPITLPGGGSLTRLRHRAIGTRRDRMGL
jgi:hypothetical protein